VEENIKERTEEKKDPESKAVFKGGKTHHKKEATEEEGKVVAA